MNKKGRTPREILYPCRGGVHPEGSYTHAEGSYTQNGHTRRMQLYRIDYSNAILWSLYSVAKCLWKGLNRHNKNKKNKNQQQELNSNLKYEIKEVRIKQQSGPISHFILFSLLCSHVHIGDDVVLRSVVSVAGWSVEINEICDFEWMKLKWMMTGYNDCIRLY